MHPLFRLAGIGLAMASAAQSAAGCTILMQRPLEFIDTADIVVSGEIANYEIVLDAYVRERDEQRLADPDLPPAWRMSIERNSGYISDYARFDILVQEVVAGVPPSDLSVVWNNSTFSEPKSLPPLRYLFALKKRPAIDPVEATASRQPILSDPASFEVLQWGCSPPFMLMEGSLEAEAARKRIEAASEE